MRLIDADELLKHKGNCYDAEGHLLYAVGTGDIMAAKTIDPVKHGRWKNKQMHDEELNEIQVFRHRCSECRFEICTADETLWWNYCPNCGAKMDGGEDETH